LKAKELRTIYQQQPRYIQVHGINCSPVELFNRDLAKQIKEWRKSGERIVLVMDVNDHPLTSKFYQQLQEEQMGLEEFTHKCWGPTPPYTHISGSSPIDGGYKSSEIEIVNLGMLTFRRVQEITGHSSLIFRRTHFLENSGSRSVGL